MKNIKSELANIGFVYALAIGLVCLAFLVVALPSLIEAVPLGQALTLADPASAYLTQ